MKIHVNMDLDLSSLANDMIVGMPRSEILEFIKRLDEKMQDWNFTLKLAEHFNKLKESYEKL